MEKRVSCPFTWGLKMLPHQRASAKRNLNDYMFEGIPLMSFMINMVKCFESIEEDEDVCTALKCLLEAKTILTKVQKAAKTRDIGYAVEHIYQATAVYIINKNDPTNEIDINETIMDVKNFNDVELAGLAGCKSFVLSLYQLNFLDEAISLARKATEGDRGNALWYYLLGHGLRKKRRNFVGCNTAPCPFEIDCFSKAAKLDPHMFYQIYHMQALHEVGMSNHIPKWERKKFAQEQWNKYKNIWQNCDEPTILLKIALGMMRCRFDCDYNIIHSVLDKVDRLSKDNNVTYHYRGRLYRFQGDLEQACKYLQLAGNMYNWAADYGYVECMVDLKKPVVDIIMSLVKMKIKYKDNNPDEQLTTYLHLAIMYFIISDYKISAELFLQAIEMSPQSVKLRVVPTIVRKVANFRRTRLIIVIAISTTLVLLSMPLRLWLMQQLHASEN